MRNLEITTQTKSLGKVRADYPSSQSGDSGVISAQEGPGTEKVLPQAGNLIPHIYGSIDIILSMCPS